MLQDFKDEVLDPSLQPDENPRYTIKDNNGKVINDDVQIDMKTPVVQNPTPLNRANIRNLQGDLYTVDRYNMVTFEQRILEVDYITDILVRETQHTGNCIPQSGWQPVYEGSFRAYSSNGWQITDDWTIGTATNNVTNAFDGDTNTKFQSKNGTGYANIIINCPYPVKITKMKTFIGTTKSSDFGACAIQGYKDGEWINIYNYGSNYQTQLTEIEITNPDYFEQYQIYLRTSSLGNAYIAEIEVSEYYTGVFGIRDYCADLDLPLTSYEKNKKISIEMSNKILDLGTGETYIETIDNPSIDINNKGAKRINGSIEYGQKYELVYNGESWDVVNHFISGTYTGNSSVASGKQEISLPFTPDLIIVGGENTAATYFSTKKIHMGSNFNNSETKYGSTYGRVVIIKNGFEAYNGNGNVQNFASGMNQTDEVYNYIAIKF